MLCPERIQVRNLHWFPINRNGGVEERDREEDRGVRRPVTTVGSCLVLSRLWDPSFATRGGWCLHLFPLTLVQAAWLSGQVRNPGTLTPQLIAECAAHSQQTFLSKLPLQRVTEPEVPGEGQGHSGPLCIHPASVNTIPAWLRGGWRRT